MFDHERDFLDCMRGIREFSKMKQETEEFLLTLRGLCEETGRKDKILFRVTEYYFVTISPKEVCVGREGVMLIDLGKGYHIPRKQVEVFWNAIPGLIRHIQQKYPQLAAELDFFIQFGHRYLQPSCAV